MSPSTCTLQVAVLVFLFAKGFGGRTVVIPEAASAIEHAPLRLDCFYMDTITVTESVCRWGIAGNGTTTLIGIYYDDCLFTNLFEEIYSFECTNKTATSMIIKSTDRKLHGTVFSCSYFVNSFSTTDTVTIQITVPVSSVKLTEPEIDIITTTENGTVTCICIASAAHPKPRIVWFNDSQTPLDYRDDIAITNTFTEISDSDGYLYTVMSNLAFYPTRYDNGSRIYCNASNTEDHSISSKRKALLNVQYPPSNPIFFMSSNVSVKNVAVIINTPLMIRCKSNGNPFPNFKWTNTQNKVVSGEDLYIENIKKADDGTYSCMAYNALTTAGETRYHNTTASIEITVLYPPESPKFFYLRPGITEQIASSTLKVVKGDKISVYCNSTGKPRPISVWNGTESSDLLLIKSIGADVNNTCTSSNVMIETAGVTHIGLESRDLTIIALYPPGTPIIKIHLSGDIVEVLDVISVIENTNILLECSAESKPLSTFTWSRPVNENLKDPSNQLFINRILRNQSGTYTCHAKNEMVRSFGDKEIGKNDRSIYVDVLYPPDTPNFYYLTHGQKQKIHTLQLKVVERDNVSVFCNSTGNPSPKTVWMDNVTHKDTFSIASVEIQHQINITCKALNMMKDTFGVSENGTSLNNLSLIVLYPPQNPVIHIQLQSNSTSEAVNYTGILEGSYFRLYCDAVSNPSPSYRWTGPVASNHMSTSAELFVHNIQRNQSGPYICYAENKIERSFGNTETGRNNQSIYFDILYKAAIKYFGATDIQNNKNMMTVDQGEDMRVICRAESNPFANNTIFFKGSIVNETIHSDTVFYNLLNTGCSDAGRYICKGKNEYNYKTDASKELFVYVKCPPQPSADHPPEKNVSAALTGSALFRFHAAPYYDPGITHFRWFKQGNDSNFFLRNGTKTYISSSDIHTFLRIDDVSEVDYGMYILEYNNSFGTNNFTFYLQQKDQTISEDNHQSNDKNYLPIVIVIVTAVLVIVGITLGIVIYIKRYQKKADNGNRSYDNICGMHAKSSENTSVSSPVYEGLKPTDERGYLEMKEQAYDILTPTKDSVETNDPVYTNLKL